MYKFRTVQKLEDFDWKRFIRDCSQVRLVNRFRAKRIVAYGCGELGQMFKEFSEHEKILIDCFVDKNWRSVSKRDYWKNTVIQSIESLRAFDPDDTTIVICVANFSLEGILQDLKDLGFRNVITFYDFAKVIEKSYPIDNGWYFDITKVKISRVKNILNNLADKNSIAHYLTFLAWRIHRCELQFPEFPIDTSSRFLIDEVYRNRELEHRLIDVGSHHGEAVRKIFNKVGTQLKKVWAFEADPVNFQTLGTSIKQFLPPNIEISLFQRVIWKESVSIKFANGFNYASRIQETGTPVNAITLDSLKLNPTIIKIHTEGSELDVLKGAMKTIEIHRPCIMMTVYHNPSGLFETLEFVFENLTQYVLYFRNHSYHGTGATVYAIPRQARTGN
ncbi:MAG: FkbM family methyltransferase [Rhodospirillaceae bacterium]